MGGLLVGRYGQDPLTLARERRLSARRFSRLDAVADLARDLAQPCRGASLRVAN